jgi:hypothetical protein
MSSAKRRCITSGIRKLRHTLVRDGSVVIIAVVTVVVVVLLLLLFFIFVYIMVALAVIISLCYSTLLNLKSI